MVQFGGLAKGKRGAFAGHPEVYSPRFASYDPIAIGRSVPGHPLFWAEVGPRLYLFYIMSRCRAAFLADPGRIIDNAERKWPDNLGQ
jgi:hypothetical protein